MPTEDLSKSIEKVSKGNGVLTLSTLLVGLYCAQALWSLDNHVETIIDEKLEDEARIMDARFESLQANLELKIRDEVERAFEKRRTDKE